MIKKILNLISNRDKTWLVICEAGVNTDDKYLVKTFSNRKDVDKYRNDLIMHEGKRLIITGVQEGIFKTVIRTENEKTR